MIKIFDILIIICILIHQSNAQEADYRSALDNINEDVKLEMSKLSELRQMIANERPKLAEQTEKLPLSFVTKGDVLSWLHKSGTL